MSSDCFHSVLVLCRGGELFVPHFSSVGVFLRLRLAHLLPSGTRMSTRQTCGALLEGGRKRKDRVEGPTGKAEGTQTLANSPNTERR